MTPALQLLKKAGVAHQVHTYAHDAACTDFWLEAAQKLGIDGNQMFKTLVVRNDSGQLALCLVSVHDKVDLKKLAQAMNSKKADLAEPAMAEKTTGYVVGGISPLGSRKQLPAFLDQSVLLWETIYVSAGKRGLQVELPPTELVKLMAGNIADLAIRH